MHWTRIDNHALLLRRRSADLHVGGADPAVQVGHGLDELRSSALRSSACPSEHSFPCRSPLASAIDRQPSVTVAALIGGAASLVLASLSAGLDGAAAALFGFGAGFGAINVPANA